MTKLVQELSWKLHNCTPEELLKLYEQIPAETEVNSQSIHEFESDRDENLNSEENIEEHKDNSSSENKILLAYTPPLFKVSNLYLYNLIIIVI